jgi:hypothetical protein
VLLRVRKTASKAPDSAELTDRHEPAGKRELTPWRWGRAVVAVRTDAGGKKARCEVRRGKDETVDFRRMKPDGGTTNIRNIDSKH